MSSPRDILVITTSEPANKKINRHLKPITSHIVAGTNIINDAFASWSDIFGGRSKTYQKQLTSLYTEAIERLQYQAYQLGADCIVGLKIDIDEISGGGKSMFMITAIGTAANYEKAEDNQLHGNKMVDGAVSISDIEDLKIRTNYIAKAKEGNLELTSQTWDYLISNRVSEAYDFLLNEFIRYFDAKGNYPGEVMQIYKEHFKNYLNSLERDDQIELFYKTLTVKEIGPSTKKLMKLMIQTNKLFDFDKVWMLLNSDSFIVQKRAIELVEFDKVYYNFNDLKNWENLNKYINENFKEVVRYTSKKQMLTGKEVEVWECNCGKQNHIELEHCSKCQKDAYGFYPDELNPPKAQKIILEKMYLIEKLLPSNKLKEPTT